LFKTVLNKDFSAANMDNEVPTDRPTSDALDQTETLSVPHDPPTLDIKPGIRLPKTQSRWTEANAYFKSILDMNEVVDNIDEYVVNMQNTVYNYFATSCGTVPVRIGSSASEYERKYVNVTVNSLKQSLRGLKLAEPTANLEEIRYVSRLIRNRINGKHSIDRPITESDFRRNFWGSCRATFTRAMNNVPTFTLSKGAEYFGNVLRQVNNKQSFSIPRWMPKLPKPSGAYVDHPPTYQEIAKIKKRAKPGASACPIDQLSILSLKHCPMLRTLLHRVVTLCWERKQIPECWKRGATILVYKKGDPADPANYLSITLQTVWYKVFAALYKQCLYDQLKTCNSIEMNLQKGRE